LLQSFIATHADAQVGVAGAKRLVETDRISGSVTRAREMHAHAYGRRKWLTRREEMAELHSRRYRRLGLTALVVTPSVRPKACCGDVEMGETARKFATPEGAALCPTAAHYVLARNRSRPASQSGFLGRRRCAEAWSAAAESAHDGTTRPFDRQDRPLASATKSPEIVAMPRSSRSDLRGGAMFGNA